MPRKLNHTMVSNSMAYCVLVLLVVSLLPCALWGHKYDVRGLDPKHKPRYHPGRDFTCLDGSDTIAFSMGI